ncbi:ead/Ea22-like family protein [Klebsiella michiganensis]|uniref:ead/Ea22-like family protein n=1 Tax=Klebsiella michiganensis TaxID=1134687 RepID=UPI0031DA1707
MTTDITELAQSLKAAAEKATPGQWVAFTHADSRTFSVHTPDDKRCGDVIKWAGFDGQRKAKANAEFIALANPANVKRLVDALEKALATEAHRNLGWKEAHEQEARAEAAEKRIAELESRTVKLPEVRITVTESRRKNMTWRELGAYNEGADVTVERISKVLAAAGIKWEAE